MSLLSFAKKIVGRQGKKGSQEISKKSGAATPVADSTGAASIHAGVLGLTPLITEDSVTLQGDRQTVAFRVRPSAHKGEIIAAVKSRFGAEPVSVRTLHVRGKLRRRGQSTGASNAWKKAYVTLPAGTTIDPYAR